MERQKKMTGHEKITGHEDRRPASEPEPDFAAEHTRPTFEDEPSDLPGVNRGDESVPEGPASNGQERFKRAL